MKYYEYNINNSSFNEERALACYNKYCNTSKPKFLDDCLYELRAVPFIVIKKKYPRVCPFEQDDLASTATIKMWNVLSRKIVPRQVGQFRTYLYSTCNCAMIDQIRVLAKRFPPEDYIPKRSSGSSVFDVDNADFIQNLPEMLRKKIYNNLKKSGRFDKDTRTCISKISLLILFNKRIPYKLYVDSGYEPLFLKDVAVVYLRMALYKLRKKYGDKLFNNQEYGIDIERITNARMLY